MNGSNGSTNTNHNGHNSHPQQKRNGSKQNGKTKHKSKGKSRGNSRRGRGGKKGRNRNNRNHHKNNHQQQSPKKQQQQQQQQQQQPSKEFQEGYQKLLQRAIETGLVRGPDEKEPEENYDDMEVEAQSASIRILTRWVGRRLPDDKKVHAALMQLEEEELEDSKQSPDGDDDDDDDDGDGRYPEDTPELEEAVIQRCKEKGKNIALNMKHHEGDDKVIDILIARHFENLFKYIKHCEDPHVLANAPLLMKQFVVYGKMHGEDKPWIKKLILRHSKKGIEYLFKLFTHKNLAVVHNSVTCMAQLATLDDNLRSSIRAIGAMKAMTQLHMQHRGTLFRLRE